MKKMRLIQPPVLIPRYRMLRMPVIAAEFIKYIDVEINDENVEKLDFSEVDLVGITCQSYNAYRAFFISEKFRRKGIKTILGGVFATAMPQMALEHFDSVVVGEVEGLGKEIVDDLEKGTLKKIYKNEAPPVLTDTNMPRIDLLKNSRYYRLNFPIETSRGCPHGCNFCFVKYQYPVYRKRSLENIERDLEKWDYGVVEVIDHHCAADKKHLFEVCDIFRNMNVHSWIGEATLMSINDEKTLKKLSDSNCRMIFVGMESISDNVLKGVNKGFNNVAEYKRIIRMCQDYGIFIHAGLMWGLDGQDETVYDQTLKFCNEVKMYLAGSNIVTYFPGTKIYQEFKDTGRIVSEDLRDYDSEHITMIPEGFNAKKLLKGLKRFENKLYSYGSIFKRAFQRSNRNMMLLIDYLGFNYAYRAYYKNWVKQVQRGLKDIIKCEKKGEKFYRKDPGELSDLDSLPHCYKNAPVTYALLDWNWRMWEFWLRKFIDSKKPPGFLFNLIAIGAYIGSLLMAAGRIELFRELPALAGTILTYCIFWLTAELMIFTVSRRIRNSFFLLLASLFLSLPLLYLPFITENLIAGFLFALANFVFILKNISYFSSYGRRRAGFYKYHVFLVLSPVLNYDDAFELDLLHSTFGKSFKLIFLGIFQLLLAAGSLLSIMYMYINYPDTFIGFSYYYWLSLIPKALYLYLAFAGIMNIISGLWIFWGYKIDDYFKSPIIANSIGNFWKRFNSEYYRWALRTIYLPLMLRTRKNNKVNKLTLLFATLIPFLASIILCLYMFYPALAAGNVPKVYLYIASIFAFFFFHYVMVIIERLAFHRHSASKGFLMSLSRMLMIIITFFFVVASSSLFFIVTDKVIMPIVRQG